MSIVTDLKSKITGVNMVILRGLVKLVAMEVEDILSNLNQTGCEGSKCRYCSRSYIRRLVGLSYG